MTSRHADCIYRCMQATEFNHVASHLRPRLLEAARQILHDEDEAEDAVQDALVSLWRWRERVDTQRDVEPLLQRILRNCCLNILTVRRRRRALAAPLEELPGSTLRSLTARSNDPHASLEEKESEQRVRLRTRKSRTGYEIGSAVFPATSRLTSAGSSAGNPRNSSYCGVLSCKTEFQKLC